MSANGDLHQDGNKDVRVESTGVASRPVALAVVALAAFTLAFTIVANLVFQSLAARQRAASPPASPLAAEYAAKAPPEPRLQVDPNKDLEVLRGAEDKTLGTLAWVDRGAGIVQVPIERAMEMLVAKGVPARQGAVAPNMAARGVAPSQASEGSGAPDWQGERAGGRLDSHEHDGRGGAVQEAAPQEAHGR